jgi:hypothetical protein
MGMTLRISAHGDAGEVVQQNKEIRFKKLTLKGLSHEIFRPVYWPAWMHLGLNKNRFWFLNFKEALSI